MNIKDVKISLSHVGVTTEKEHTAHYMLRAAITYNETSKPKRLYLDLPEHILITKKMYQGYMICQTFFVLLIDGTYNIFDADGNYKTSLLKSDVGQCVGVDIDYFTCLVDKTVTGYDINGKSIGSRELTPEELADLTK